MANPSAMPTGILEPLVAYMAGNGNRCVPRLDSLTALALASRDCAQVVRRYRRQARQQYIAHGRDRCDFYIDEQGMRGSMIRDMPTYVSDNQKLWLSAGKLHRSPSLGCASLPASIILDENRKPTYVYYDHGRIHRTDGPAVDGDGLQEWYIFDKLHRDAPDPAVISNGYRAWYHHGHKYKETTEIVEPPAGGALNFLPIYCGSFLMI